MMRHLKILGLALVAGLAAMAFVGASSASAKIDMCTAWNLATPPAALTKAECEKAGGTVTNLLNKLLLIKAVASNPVLKGTINETCETSETSVMNFGNGEAEGLKGKVEELSFTGNCSPCSTVTTTPPYAGALVMEGEEYFLESAGSATLSGCTFGVKCKFGTTGVKLKLAYNTGMAMNEFRAEEEVLKLEEGSKFLCGATGKWTANYVVEGEHLHFFFFLL
jgi:hypothetical protein